MLCDAGVGTYLQVFWLQKDDNGYYREPHTEHRAVLLISCLTQFFQPYATKNILFVKVYVTVPERPSPEQLGRYEAYICALGAALRNDAAIQHI